MFTTPWLASLTLFWLTVLTTPMQEDGTWVGKSIRTNDELKEVQRRLNLPSNPWDPAEKPLCQTTRNPRPAKMIFLGTGRMQ